MRRLWRIRGEIVEFRTLRVTCVLVSLSCPISSDVFIHAKRSEDSLKERIRLGTRVEGSIREGESKEEGEEERGREGGRGSRRGSKGDLCTRK